MDAPTSPSSAEAAASRAGGTDDSHVRVVAWSNGETRRLEGMSALRTTLAEPDTLLWVDLSADGQDEVAEVAKLLELHPLIAEDVV